MAGQTRQARDGTAGVGGAQVGEVLDATEMDAAIIR